MVKPIARFTCDDNQSTQPNIPFSLCNKYIRQTEKRDAHLHKTLFVSAHNGSLCLIRDPRDATCKIRDKRGWSGVRWSWWHEQGGGLHQRRDHRAWWLLGTSCQFECDLDIVTFRHGVNTVENGTTMKSEWKIYNFVNVPVSPGSPMWWDGETINREKCPLASTRS